MDVSHQLPLHTVDPSDFEHISDLDVVAQVRGAGVGDLAFICRR